MKKSFIITSMAAFAALCFSLTAQAQGPVVVSDKDDYSPGETALFQATGFQPGELLDFSVAISDDEGGWVPDIAWADVPADPSGGAEVDYIVPQTWADKTLQLTVMGLTSGLMAQTTFTDSVTSVTVTAVNGVPVASLPVTITSLPANLTVTFDYVTSASGATTADLDLLTTPTTISNTGVSIPAGTHTGQTISVTIPSGTTNQTANVKVTVHNSDGSGANNKNDNVNNAVTIAVPTPTATPTATEAPSATPTPTACTNQSPVIHCASPTPNADLGKAVGCLVNGGFSHDYPVTYSTDPANGVGSSVTVKASFTLPDPSATPVTVNIATVDDPDGDTVTVTLPSPTPPASVTISGPGSGTSNFSVAIHAVDNNSCPMNNTVDGTCGGTATADIIYHVAYLPPLDGQRNCKVKQGSTVPVKIRLTDCNGVAITPVNIPGDRPTLDMVKYLSGSAPDGDPTVDNAGNSGDTCNPICYFRWSPAPDLFWIFNLQTNSGYYVGNSYEIWPSPVDGPTYISIK